MPRPRRRRRVKRLDDIKKWKAENLAKFGGFSHKFIASLVFQKPIERVTEKERGCIASYLCRNGIRISDWRNGQTVPSRQYAREHTSSQRERERRRVLGLPLRPARRRAAA